MSTTATETQGPAPDATRLSPADPAVRTFLQLLGNVLSVSVVNLSMWFAITFFVYLQTASVFATGIIAGIYLVSTAGTGIFFGGIVDHHRKKTVLLASAAISLGLYATGLVFYLANPADAWRHPADPRLWVLVVLLMAGMIAGNLRTIALPTMVTALFDEARRGKANGLVGTTSGISFLISSVISGVLVGATGMLGMLVLGVVVLAGSLLHLRSVRVPERLTVAAADPADKKLDLRGTIRIVGQTRGLFALIIFTTINNFLFGGFMALMDPYGLSMMSVQVWGLALGALSSLTIVGGLLITKTGVSSNPVRLLLLINLTLWTVTIIFPLQASVILLLGGMALFMLLMPFAEASEQAVLQQVVPYERQGRVFGFAQSVEQSASPLTAFLISPLAQFVFMPFMTDGAGAALIGSWFGTGPERGIALVFVIMGLAGLALTAFALTTKHYRALSARFRGTAQAKDTTGDRETVDAPLSLAPAA
ncbi:MFS transporter [Microlunatus parietis]|uniref:DHA3 family multidrug efflux protein-like MFS transporter n=1 Tax=Microlunatus parietis TaxID=682979 RepID=A0A7Y9IAJ1_9ACTN|nr:MFS transporter [Microlunatus parietis]NYE73073.1 DHA3 family multidrug efflux protein-like MFS transporter [Microlunatus parietis]